MLTPAESCIDVLVSNPDLSADVHRVGRRELSWTRVKGIVANPRVPLGRWRGWAFHKGNPMDEIRSMFWQTFLAKGLENWEDVEATQAPSGHILVTHKLEDGGYAREVLLAFHHSIIPAVQQADAERRARILERSAELVSRGLFMRYDERSKDVAPFLVQIGAEALDA